MALVLCSDIEPVKVQAFGNWFEFKPGQVKIMDKRLADFLCSERRSYGFMALPEQFEDDRQSSEFKEAVEAATKVGKQNIVNALHAHKNNIEVSFKKDLDMANIKVDPLDALDPVARANALAVYRKLAKLQLEQSDESSIEIAEMKKLKEQIDGNAKRA